MGCKRVPTVLQVGVGQLAVHAVEAIHKGAEFAGITARNLFSRPPHRKRSERGWCRGVRGSDEAELVLVEVAA